MRALLLILGLSACASVNPVTLARLAATSPLEADPAGFEVIVRLPDGLDVVPDSAVLTLSANRGTDSFDGRYVLARRDDGAGGAGFAVRTSDLADLRRQQALARRWEAEAPRDTSGSLSIDFTPCLIGDGPSGDARVSVDIVLEPGGDARPLLPPTRLSKLVKAMDPAALDALPLCSSQSEH